MPQFVVSGVHAGRSLCLLFDNGQPVSVADVKTRVQELEGVPAAEQRLLLDSSDLPDDHTWPSLSPESKAGDDGLVLLSVRLRLSGGKGGFGSLLRGGPAGVTVKKTTNFDACRDLSGRRLRHVNQEKKLAEWRQGEAERKLAEKSEKFTKAQASTVKRTFDDRKFSEQTEKMRTSISAALEDGLKNEGSLKVETQKLKRAAEESTSVMAPSKKTRLWTPLLDDLEEEEGGQEEDQKQDEQKTLSKSTQPDSPPSTATAATKTTATTTTTTTTTSSSTTTTSNVSTSNTAATCTDTTTTSTTPCTSSSAPNTAATTATATAASVSSSTVRNGGEKTEKAELLDLTQFGSAEELEKLGPDTLKLELQKRGMLCGGKVQERAARLFAVKGLVLDKIPKHLKPNTKAKK